MSNTTAPRTKSQVKRRTSTLRCGVKSIQHNYRTHEGVGVSVIEFIASTEDVTLRKDFSRVTVHVHADSTPISVHESWLNIGNEVTVFLTPALIEALKVALQVA